MITCMGLVVGNATTSKQDVVNQCARFLDTYRHLLKVGTEFEVCGVHYATIIDICDEDHRLWVLFETLDGVGCGIA